MLLSAVVGCTTGYLAASFPAAREAAEASALHSRLSGEAIELQSQVRELQKKLEPKPNFDGAMDEAALNSIRPFRGFGPIKPASPR